MKRYVCLLIILSLLLCGCVSDPLQGEKNPTEEETAPPPKPVQTTAPTEPAQTQPTEPVHLVDNIVFDHWYSNGLEQGSLTAYDKTGNAVWTYQTGSYDVGQLDFIADIGSFGSSYYIVEDNSILSFDRETGVLLWENKEFCGSPANTDCAVFDEEGNLYICGFFGPDLFVVDANGKTLYHDDFLHYDYYWACGMTLTENWLAIQLDGGPWGDMSTPYVAYVNIDRLSGNALSLAEAAELTQNLYNTVNDADGTYVVFEEECSEDGGYYTMIVRYQLSDAEAEQILASGGIPEANTYVATVSVDIETGYIFPEV